MTRALLLALLPFVLLLGAPSALAYKPLGALWDADKGPVRYHLEPSGSDDIDDGSDLEAVRDAFRAWACVEGSRLRFEEGARPGAHEANDDGINSVFWDETGSFGLGPATLGVTIGNAGPADDIVERTHATIVFNGSDHGWSTSDQPRGQAVDVGSIAAHEIGHWLGLGHPCEDPQESVCLGDDVTVMTPAWPGFITRTPLADDVEGIRALYPATDESTCAGPFRLGERCSCDDDCVDGLSCVEGEKGPVCSPPCSGDDVACPFGFACVLGASGGGAAAPGVCRQFTGAHLPPASSCQNDGQCGDNLCAQVATIGRTVCRLRCESEGCPVGYACRDDVCVGEAAGTPCPSDEEEEAACGCSSAPAGAPVPGALALVAAAFALVVSRMKQCRRIARQQTL